MAHDDDQMIDQNLTINVSADPSQGPSSYIEKKSKQAPKSTRSIISMEKNIMMKAMQVSLVQNLVDISEFKVEFRVGRFLRLFVYHILYFIIGPLSSLFCIIFDTIGLAGNAAFWPKTSVLSVFFFQLFQWIPCLYFYGMWFLHFFCPEKNYLSGIYFE